MYMTTNNVYDFSLGLNETESSPVVGFWELWNISNQTFFKQYLPVYSTPWKEIWITSQGANQTGERLNPMR